MTNILDQNFECPCKPGFKWKTKTTFKGHMKNKDHQIYELTREVRDFRIERDRLQIKVNSLEKALIGKDNLQIRVDSLERALKCVEITLHSKVTPI